MAEIYLGYHKNNPDHLLAMKVLLPKLATQSKFVDMFRSEGELGKLLKHPNICKTLGVFKHKNIVYIVLDFIAGTDLGVILQYFKGENVGMPIPMVMYIASQILKGLDFAHTLCDKNGNPLDLVNRDISPANTMFSYDGEVKLIDFGIAQATLDYRQQIGSIKGKIRYMSPEQVRGLPVDARSDLFSLGIVLYRALTGRDLFKGQSDFEQMENVRSAPIPVPSSFHRKIDPELDTIIMTALQRDPAQRFYSAFDMDQAITAYCEKHNLTYSGENLSEFMTDTFSLEKNALQELINNARQALSAQEILHVYPIETEPPPIPQSPPPIPKAAKVLTESEPEPSQTVRYMIIFGLVMGIAVMLALIILSILLR